MLIALMLLGCTPSSDDTSVEDLDTSPDRDPVPLTLIAFNIEGRESSVAGLAETAMDEVVGEAIWGLSEVTSPRLLRDLAEVAGGEDEPFESVLGTTGSSLRLALLWDPTQVTLDESWELEALNIGGTGRAPLVGSFRTVETDVPFVVVVNHLWRSEDRYRHEQAEGLNLWVQEQDLPAIALGDFNFDWVVPGGEDDHDRGYDLMTEDDHWVWLRPDELIMTQCNARYSSVLDFVFVANAAQDWTAESTIRNPNNSYCRDDDERSDHRPVQADILIP